MRSAIAYGTYPLGLALAVGVTWFWISHAPPGRGQETLAVATVLCALSAVALVLQHLLPRVEAWESWRGDFGLDVAHGLMSTIGGATLARLLFFGAIAKLSAAAAASGWGIWPDHWPIWLQLPLALVISDFIVYWLHRASHRLGPLWRLHELHHTSERLYALSSGRTHPVYVALSTALTTAPLLALGADPPVLAMLSVLVGANGIIQHSNVALECSTVDWLLASADMHRWHHAVDLQHQCSNYGNTLSLWDRLFGTLDLPEDLPESVGLGAPTSHNFLVQLVRPFLPRRLTDAA